MTVAYTKDAPDSLRGQVVLVTWVLASGETGAGVEMGNLADRSAQVAGTFGGASVGIQGSLDGTNWASLTDPQGNALTFSGAKIETVVEMTRYLRPVVTGGDETTDLTVTVMFRVTS